jgi:hypothetical protein
MRDPAEMNQGSVASEARYQDWPDEARELVERSCERHGGWSRFSRLESVTATVSALGGPLPVFKGLGITYPPPRVVRVAPRAERVTFVDWPANESEGRYGRGSVNIAGSPDHAAESSGHRTKMPALRWRPLDALYFFGYALSNYWALPFLLASTRFARLDARRVVVDFPERFDTHSRRQAFLFDDTGLLVRHDYTADVVGPWATGSHFSTDYENVDGLWLARGRRVVWRLGSFATPVPVLYATFEDFAVG